MASERFAEVRVRYDDPPEPTVEHDTFRLRLPSDGVRGAARLVAVLNRPGVMRDALLTLGEILASDLRFRAQDRSDYLAYVLSKGSKVTKELWEAQKRFLEAKYSEATLEESPLDPVVTVAEDGLSIEVFSADESAYARLFLRAGAAYSAAEMNPGTTHLRVTDKAMRAIAQMRSYRGSTLEISPSGGGDEVALKVPYRWVRALSQVQAASTLPAATCELRAVDLYNVLLALRMRRAKKSPRALRYELVPGAPPRLVLEPWDLVLEGTGEPYRGSRPQVVRTWGRKRLGVLARLLPHARSVRVSLIGAGLPAYYVVDLGDAVLTLALSGWTDSGWAGITTFDLLAAPEPDPVLAKQLETALEAGGKTVEELCASAARDPGEVRQTLLGMLHRGELVFDVATQTFVRRPLFAEPLAVENIKYRDAREEEAHRLLAVEGQVRLLRVHDLGGEGVRIEGEVDDKQSHRTYQTSFTIDREGRTVNATCSSPQFRRSGLKEGPTVPMIALRLFYARQQAELERARGTEEGRKLIRAETRQLIRRDARGAEVCRLTLDDRQVVLRWGIDPNAARMHRLMFGTAEEARDDYFGRLAALADKGFIDASAAEAV